jgi:hypothetical protein
MRRSSSDLPPQTPASCPVSIAQERQSSVTEHRRQMVLAASTCRSDGPIAPMGKNSSGSSSWQRALWRQSIRLLLVESSRCPLLLNRKRKPVCLVLPPTGTPGHRPGDRRLNHHRHGYLIDAGRTGLQPYHTCPSAWRSAVWAECVISNLSLDPHGGNPLLAVFLTRRQTLTQAVARP